MPPLISVVIPVLNDSGELHTLLRSVGSPPGVEVVVAHAGAPDETFTAARKERPDVRWVAAPAGRAVQMNAGASQATGRWLLFLHADTRLDPDWVGAIARLDADPIVGGSFRFALRSAAWQARLIEWGVGLRVRVLGLPYGDQGIFVRREAFDRLNGYSQLPLMEDVDFIRRLRRHGALRHLDIPVHVSARRWERDGWSRRTLGNLRLVILYFLGADPDRLARAYYRRSPAQDEALEEARS
jgi:rSAM/selenodomain-associated transferase 2